MNIFYHIYVTKKNQSNILVYSVYNDIDKKYSTTGSDWYNYTQNKYNNLSELFNMNCHINGYTSNNYAEFYPEKFDEDKVDVKRSTSNVDTNSEDKDVKSFNNENKMDRNNTTDKNDIKMKNKIIKQIT